MIVGLMIAIVVTARVITIALFSVIKNVRKNLFQNRSKLYD